jgi:hypothetical protein
MLRAAVTVGTVVICEHQRAGFLLDRAEERAKRAKK